MGSSPVVTCRSRRCWRSAAVHQAPRLGRSSPMSPDPLCGSAPPTPSSAMERYKFVLFGVDAHHHLRRLCILGRVCESFGDNVIGGYFDRVGQPSVDAKAKHNRNGRTTGQRLKRRAKPTFGKNRRMDPAGYLLEICRYTLQARDDVRKLSRKICHSGGTMPRPCAAVAPTTQAAAGRRRADRARNGGGPRQTPRRSWPVMP